MNVPASLTVPVEHRADIGAYILVVAAFASGVGAGFLGRAHTVTHTRVVQRSIAQQYGKPSASVDGAKVNTGLKGLTCSIYRSRRTVICQP